MNLIFLLVFQWNLYGGDSESIWVPMDHVNPNSKKIEINYSYENDFLEERETVFILDDPLDAIFKTYGRWQNIKQQFNIVRIEGRHHLQVLKDEIISFDTIDWIKAYQVYNQFQIVSDIETIRKKLLGEKKVQLIGFSSSASTFNYYTFQFPDKVGNVICLSPLIFDIQSNLRFDKPDLNIEVFKNHLSNKQIYDFFFYSSFDFLNSKLEERNKITQSTLLNYTYFHFLFLGFSTLQTIRDNIGLKVRIFEHSYAYDNSNAGSLLEHNVISDLMRESSKAMWEVYAKHHFDVFGIHYDKGEKYLGNILILGGAYDLLINSNSFEILAEFFRHSTLILLKDGHSLNNIRSAGLLEDFILSILENSFDKKVGALDALIKYDLVFIKKNSLIKRKRYW